MSRELVCDLLLHGTSVAKLRSTTSGPYDDEIHPAAEIARAPRLVDGCLAQREDHRLLPRADGGDDGGDRGRRPAAAILLAAGRVLRARLVPAVERAPLLGRPWRVLWARASRV